MTAGGIVLLLILASTALRLAFGAALGLGVDESYMVASGRVLSLGYYDHPPAAWWLSWSAAHLFASEAPIVVRLPFIALFALSTWLMYRLGAAIADARAGLWAAVLLNLSPVFGVTTGTWVLPDGPLDCALLGAALCLVRALERGALAWWLGAGFCAGLALLSKYSAALTMAGGVLYLLSSREHRHWLATPKPWLALLVALLMFAPVLAWNAAHGWASFAFQAGRATGHAPQAVRPTGDACRRGAVRSAMDLAADDGRVRGRAAPRSRRVAALAAVLSGRAANRRVRCRLRLVEPARAVPLGGAWLSDAVSAAG